MRQVKGHKYLPHEFNLYPVSNRAVVKGLKWFFISSNMYSEKNNLRDITSNGWDNRLYTEKQYN